MPRAILDENVSLQVAARLEALGYEVTAISKHPERGMQDEAVFALAKGCILVTRDAQAEDFAGHLVFLSSAGSRIR